MRCDLKAGHFPRAAAILVFVGACLLLSVPLSAQESKPRATLAAHTLGVSGLAFSSDGKTLVSGGVDDLDDGFERSIKLWDVATGKITDTLKAADRDSGGFVAISPDGKMLATWVDGGKINLWNVATGKLTAQLEHGSDHSRRILVFSPDGKMLASGGMCVIGMSLWDVATGRNLFTINENNIVTDKAMAFMPDGKTLASMDDHGVVKLWDVATGKNTVTVKTDDFVSGAAFSPDGKTVATGYDDNDNVILWEVATGKQVAILKAHAAGANVWSPLVFSSDGKCLAAADENDGKNEKIQLWNVATGKEQATLRGRGGYVRCLSFSPDGKTLASGGEDKTIKLWDVSTSKPATP